MNDVAARKRFEYVRDQRGVEVPRYLAADGTHKPISALKLFVAGVNAGLPPAEQHVWNVLVELAKVEVIDGREEWVIRHWTARQLALKYTRGGRHLDIRTWRRGWAGLEARECLERVMVRGGANVFLLQPAGILTADVVHGFDVAEPSRSRLPWWLDRLDEAERPGARTFVDQVLEATLGHAPSARELRKYAPRVLAFRSRARSQLGGEAALLERVRQVHACLYACVDARLDGARGIDASPRGRTRAGHVPERDGQTLRPRLDLTILPDAQLRMAFDEDRWQLAFAHASGLCACHVHAKNGGSEARRSRWLPPVDVDQLVREAVGLQLDWVGTDPSVPAPRLRVLLEAGRRDDVIQVAVRCRRELTTHPVPAPRPGDDVDASWPGRSREDDVLRWLEHVADRMILRAQA